MANLLLEGVEVVGECDESGFIAWGRTPQKSKEA